MCSVSGIPQFTLFLTIRTVHDDAFVTPGRHNGATPGESVGSTGVFDDLSMTQPRTLVVKEIPQYRSVSMTTYYRFVGRAEITCILNFRVE